jgi:hypothetical protein
MLRAGIVTVAALVARFIKLRPIGGKDDIKTVHHSVPF